MLSIARVSRKFQTLYQNIFPKRTAILRLVNKFNKLGNFGNSTTRQRPLVSEQTEEAGNSYSQ